MANLCDPCSGDSKLYEDIFLYRRSLLSLYYDIVLAVDPSLHVPNCVALTEMCRDDWEFRRAILALSCIVNTKIQTTGNLFPEKDPLFTSWLATPPNISTFVNDAGYITTLAPETDPLFSAWLAGPPNISEFTNNMGYISSWGPETDPVFVAWLATLPLAGYVPYIGATADVDLGVHTLDARVVTAGVVNNIAVDSQGHISLKEGQRLIFDGA